MKVLNAHRNWIGAIVVGVLLVTGVLNLHLRGVLDAALLRTSSFWASAYGRALAWKLGPLDQGFRNMMTHVITTSRLFNAVLTVFVIPRD